MKCIGIKLIEKKWCVQKQGAETAYEHLKACQQHACNRNHQRSMNSFEISLFPLAQINDLSYRVFNYSYPPEALQCQMILPSIKTVFRIKFSSKPSLCDLASNSSLPPTLTLSGILETFPLTLTPSQLSDFHPHPHFLHNDSILSIVNITLTLSIILTISLTFTLITEKLLSRNGRTDGHILLFN